MQNVWQQNILFLNPIMQNIIRKTEEYLKGRYILIFERYGEVVQYYFWVGVFGASHYLLSHAKILRITLSNFPTEHQSTLRLELVKTKNVFMFSMLHIGINILNIGDKKSSLIYEWTELIIDVYCFEMVCLLLVQIRNWSI